MSVNTTAISTGKAREALRAGFAAQGSGQMTASWMLHGRPGIGETEIVQQPAHDTGSQLFDLRLTTIPSAQSGNGPRTCLTIPPTRRSFFWMS